MVDGGRTGRARRHDARGQADTDPTDPTDPRIDPAVPCDHNDHMKMPRPPSVVGSRELKTRLGSYLRKVRAGATLVVTDRGRPVAELRPIGSGKGTLEDRLAELAAIGVVSWKGIVGAFPTAPPPLRMGTKRLSSALKEGREDRF